MNERHQMLGAQIALLVHDVHQSEEWKQIVRHGKPNGTILFGQGSDLCKMLAAN